MKMLKINDSIPVDEFAQYLEWAFQKKKNGEVLQVWSKD